MKLIRLRNNRFVLGYYSFFFLIAILISSCAQIGSPTGGALDRTPPRVVRYQPDSATVNFKARSIEITFDEFVQIQELSNQLLISPPLEYSPDIAIKKKTLSVVFNKKEVLKPNTTYSISFGNAIKDTREATPLENFRYTFSTGSFIDSLTLSGGALYAFDHKAEKNILVMLYSDLSDSAIYKKLPDYFAKTNDAGAFKINNIRKGKYRVVALKDGNNNFKYNDEEDVGFLDSLVEAGTPGDLLIDMYRERPKKIFLKKYTQAQYGKFILTFNQGTDSLRISRINKEELKDVKELIQFSKTKDTITYWMDPVDKDSLILQVNNGNTILDTIEFKLVKRETALKAGNRNPLKLYLTNPMNGELFDLNRELRLIFSNPIVKVDPSKVILMKEDTLVYTKYPLIFSSPDPPNTVIKITAPVKTDVKNSKTPASGRNMLLKDNTAYRMLIPPAAFTDFFGLTNDTLKFNFKTKEEKYYGTVKLNLKFAETTNNYLVQLLDDKENVIRENSISKPGVIFYDFLYPQPYKLKVIVDKNGNGKWDPGNYLKKQQPEKVIYNTEAVNIRSNWDLDLDWNIIEPK
jgi:hypothetical protein